jgi:hypothetical protein
VKWSNSYRDTQQLCLWWTTVSQGSPVDKDDTQSLHTVTPSVTHSCETGPLCVLTRSHDTQPFLPWHAARAVAHWDYLPLQGAAAAEGVACCHVWEKKTEKAMPRLQWRCSTGLNPVSVQMEILNMRHAHDPRTFVAFAMRHDPIRSLQSKSYL